MKIVFDMDNTLADEQGATLRPGIKDLLTLLQREKHTLILWTNSKKARAIFILRELGIRNFFHTIIAREDYDPDFRGINKDCRRIKADLFIDDDPIEVDYNKKNGIRSFLLAPYRKNKKMAAGELDELRKFFK